MNFLADRVNVGLVIRTIIIQVAIVRQEPANQAAGANYKIILLPLLTNCFSKFQNHDEKVYF